MENFFENNNVSLVGKIESEFVYSHEVYGESFYTVTVAVPRMSDYVDHIPVMVSERLIDVKKDYPDTYICIEGQFRSFNRHDGDKTHLVLTVFARDIQLVDELPRDVPYNLIELHGYSCKKPVYRETPNGREITDVMVAVNRAYGKSDYIPCICWGRNARYASTFDMGTQFKLTGRIQSREYVKKYSATETETKVAYEVSVSKIEMLDN